MIKIGLTGAIASGKSEVEKFLKEKYQVVDLDIISHSVLENEAKKEILAEFNTLNRKIIGDIIFSNEAKKRQLENIIHPYLKKYVLNYFKKNENEKIIIISGALLFEAGFDNLFDITIYIDAAKDIRLKRLIKRNNLNYEDAKKRIESQKNEGKNKANYIIENIGTIDELKNKINILFAQFDSNFK